MEHEGDDDVFTGVLTSPTRLGGKSYSVCHGEGLSGL